MSAIAGAFAKKLGSAAANRAKKVALNQARALANRAQNQAKKLAVAKMNQMKNAGLKRAENEIRARLGPGPAANNAIKKMRNAANQAHATAVRRVNNIPKIKPF